MRTIVQIFIALTICSCTQDKKPAGKNSVDSASVLNLKPQVAPTNTFQFTCGTSELALNMMGEWGWAKKFENENRLVCSEYIIRKKNFYKFIDIFDTDSFKITNHSPTPLLDGFDETPTKDTSATSYIFISNIPEKIYIVKTSGSDSVPLKISFTADINKKLTMKMWADTSLSKRLTKILIGGHLARLNQTGTKSS